MLSTTSRSHAAGAVLQFKYVFTLTEASLSCALITTNIGNQPVSVHGSLQTSVAVNFVDGAYALGLQGCKYRPSPPNSTQGPVLTGDEMVVEKEEMVGMKGGIDRLYTEIHDSMSLLDRVSTRHSRGTWDSGCRVLEAKMDPSHDLKIYPHERIVIFV